MKNLRQLIAGLLLTLALAVPATAGQMDCPGVTPPPLRVAGETLTGDVTETVIFVLLTLIK